MRSLLKINLLAGLVLVVFILACKKKDKKDNTPDPSKIDFNRAAMLANYHSNLIVPAYTNLSRASQKLDSLVSVFTSNPDSAGLVTLQEGFKDLYRSWQSASSYGFGPADDGSLSRNMNTFPADTAKINANITSGSYNLDAILNNDAKGLPAMDYLLFGLAGTKAATVAKYTTDSKMVNRKKYLKDLSTYVRTNTAAVLSNWNSYASTFLNATGTDVGSSLGQMINEMDVDLEILKNYKLGIPMGKQSMGILFPNKVEAYYSGISSELLLLQLQSLQNIYLGRNKTSDGLGLDDYLAAANAQYASGSLNDAIKNQFSAAITKLQALPSPLSSAISNNQTLLNETYIELQKLLVLLKTDMPSALGVLITYEDNDGD